MWLNSRCISVLLLTAPLIVISLCLLCQSDCCPNPLSLPAHLIVFHYVSSWQHEFYLPMLHPASTSLINKAVSPLHRSQQTEQPWSNSGLSFPSLGIILHGISWKPRGKITEKAFLVAWTENACFTQPMIALWKFGMPMTISIVKEFSSHTLISFSNVWAAVSDSCTVVQTVKSGQCFL